MKKSTNQNAPQFFSSISIFLTLPALHSVGRGLASLGRTLECTNPEAGPLVRLLSRGTRPRVRLLSRGTWGKTWKHQGGARDS